jgi:hypothetical protein
MTTSTLELLPGTEVQIRGLRWEVVSSQSLGPQTLFRLRGLENAVLGHDIKRVGKSPPQYVDWDEEE